MQSFGRYVRSHHVGLLALFVALGGTSYAAVKLPANSVGAKQIKANAVTTSEVKNGALRVADFASGQIPAGAPGPAGPAGPAGAQGPPGAKGDAGPAFDPSVTIKTGTSALDSSAEKSASATCAFGELAIGGYYILPFHPVKPPLSVSFAGAPNPQQWIVEAHEVGVYDQDWQLVAKVYCVG